MPAPIGSLSGTPALAPEPAAPAGSHGSGFRGVLENAIQGADASRNAAADAVGKFLAGDGGELHSAILATQRANLSFDLFLQMRNKVVSAYQEIMRMQL